MGLTKAQAMEFLSTITSADELQNLIKSLDTTGTGNTTLLWSGYAAPVEAGRNDGIHSSDLTASLKKHDNNLRTIATTEAAKFLDLDKTSRDYNPDLDRKLKEIFRDDPDKIVDFLYGPTEGTPPKRTGKGIWDDVSENFVKQAKGDVRLVVGGAGLDRVFAQTEIHVLLNNPAIKSIEGVPIEGLKQLADTSGIPRVLQLLMGLSEAHTGMIQLQVDASGRPIQTPDGTYSLDATDFMKRHTLDTTVPTGMRSVMEFIPEARRIRHHQAVEEIFKLHPILRGNSYPLPIDADAFHSQTAIARISTFTGRVADVASVTTMLAEAGSQLHQGNHRGAHDTVTSWVVENAGAFAAGRLASLLVAPLMATGPVGMIIGAGIIIGASLAGSDLAKKLHKKLERRFGELEEVISPLVLDLDGNGIQTIALNRSSIYFDHNSDGFAERTGWVGINDGLLVLDLNANGRIDNGRELFGNHTRKGNGLLASNGFDALAIYDANKDRHIDNRDPIWSSLAIWRDQNSNASSDPEELLRLEDVNIKAIRLSYTNSTAIDVNGNAHRQQGFYQKTDDELAAITDVWFAQNTIDSRALHLRPVDAETALLPDLPGFGIVQSLHQALIAPGGVKLRDTVNQWLGATQTERMTLTQELLFQWCEADSTPFGNEERMYFSEDPLIKQKVAVVEKFLGKMIPGSEDGITFNQAQLIAIIAAEIQQWVHIAMSRQVDIQPLLDLAIPVETDAYGPLQMDVTASVNHLHSRFLADPDPALLPRLQWQFAQHGPTTIAFFKALKQVGSARNDTFGVVMRRQQLLTTPGEWIVGSEAEDLLAGTAQDDLLEGGDNNDWLEGHQGDDTLFGGAGDDFYFGGAGADTYYLTDSSNHDRIFDEMSPEGQRDRVIFQDLASTDVRLQINNKDAYIYAGDRLVALIQQQFLPEHQIEEFHFTDGVIWDHNGRPLPTLLLGTNGNDKLVASSSTANHLLGLSGHDTLIGGTLADVLEGHQGNDSLTGLAGRDTLDGGQGNDTLLGGEGGDVYLFAANGGQDRISDLDYRTRETDRVVFSDLNPTDLTRVQRIGTNIQLHFGPSTSLTLANQVLPLTRIEHLQFANGTTWDHTMLLRQVS